MTLPTVNGLYTSIIVTFITKILRVAVESMEELGEVTHLLETLLIRSENKRSLPGMIRALVNNRLNSLLSRPLSKAAGQAGQETDL